MKYQYIEYSNYDQFKCFFPHIDFFYHLTIVEKEVGLVLITGRSSLSHTEN